MSSRPRPDPATSPRRSPAPAGRRGPVTFRAVRLVALAALVVAACGDGGENGAVEAGEAAADTAAAAEADTVGASDSRGGRRVRGDTVVIGMDEYLIDVPRTLPPGSLVFRVENLGFEEHNLEVHRDSLLWDLRPLNPRETGFLDVALEPGRYRLICTVSGHEGRGMSEAVRVGGDGTRSPP